MGKTTIANQLKKEVTFIGKRGVYSFDFAPDIGDINKNPEKYDKYLVKAEVLAFAPDTVAPKEEDRGEYIELNGFRYKKV